MIAIVVAFIAGGCLGYMLACILVIGRDDDPSGN
jgi:hypothetical protein